MQDNPMEALRRAEKVLSNLRSTRLVEEPGGDVDEALAACQRALHPYGTMASSHGEVDFRADTGQVIEIRHDREGSDALFGITRVDVVEWQLAYPGEDIAQCHDILDFGMWWGVDYSPAELEWRNELAALRTAQQYKRGD